MHCESLCVGIYSEYRLSCDFLFRVVNVTVIVNCFCNYHYYCFDFLYPLVYSSQGLKAKRLNYYCCYYYNICRARLVTEMTYNVSSGTLSLYTTTRARKFKQARVRGAIVVLVEVYWMRGSELWETVHWDVFWQRDVKLVSWGRKFLLTELLLITTTVPVTVVPFRHTRYKLQ